MGEKKGRGAPPTLDPPIRGFMAAVGCTDRAKTSRALPPVPLAFMLQALPRLGWHASRLPCKPCKGLRYTSWARRAAAGTMPPKYHGVYGGLKTARQGCRALHRRPKLRIVRFRASPKAHSLRWASSPHDDHSVGSPRGPHWARPARGQPLWAGDHRSLLRTARRVVAPHGASGCGGKRADDIRPYRVGQLPARRAGAPREGAPRCGNGGNPSSGPAGRLPPGGG